MAIDYTPDSTLLAIAGNVGGFTIPQNSSVGEIPITSSVSQTGARVYQIPIRNAAGWRLAPSISVTYNSQSGNGLVGYGWNIGGLSSIEIRNRNTYYDGAISGASLSDQNARYCLDGIPIVQAETSIGDYTWKTAQGQMMVRRHLSPTGATAYFMVLFPNGNKGIYGFIDNTENQMSYPLSRLEDMNGNVIQFTYFSEGNLYFIQRIDYGSNAATVFYWEGRPEQTPYRAARTGKRVDPLFYRLRQITVKDGDDTLCTYSCAYNVKDGVSLLSRLECSSGGDQLPPLFFSYGIDTQPRTNNVFSCTSTDVLNHYYEKSQDNPLVAKRGHLIPRSKNSSILVHPSFDDHAITDSTTYWFRKYYEYGSDYPLDQKILVNAFAPTRSFQYELPAGAGFQTIEMVDTDGDGTDELVKVNNACSSGGTDYSITVYTFNSLGLFSTREFSITIDDNESNHSYDNPVKSWYRWGNFRGDGRTMLLIITKEANRFALVDLVTGTKVNDASLFALSEEEESLVIAADFENDGQTDLCRITTNGMDVYTLGASSSDSFSMRITYAGINSHLLRQDINTSNGYGGYLELGVHLSIIDLNGDGYPDILAQVNPYVQGGHATPSSAWNYAYFDGGQFFVRSLNLFPRVLSDEFVFIDVNKDGLPDMLHTRGRYLYYTANQNGFFTLDEGSYTQVQIDSTAKLIPCDGSIFGHHGDILVAEGPSLKLYSFGQDHGHNRRLAAVTDSFGKREINEYATLYQGDHCYGFAPDRSFNQANGFHRAHIPLTVLQAEMTSIPGEVDKFRRFYYKDAVLHDRGLGFCGFGETRTASYALDYNESDVFIHNPEKFGITTQSTHYADSLMTRMVAQDLYSYDDHSTYYGKLNPRIVQSRHLDLLTGITTTSGIIYDSRDFPTRILSSRQIGNDPAQRDTLFRSYLHSLSSNKYILGSIAEESLVKERDGDTLLAWKEKTVTTYDSAFRPLTRQYFVGNYGFIPDIAEDEDEIAEEEDNGLSNPSSLQIRTIIHEPEYPPEDPEDPEEPGEPGGTDVTGTFVDATNLVSETRWQYDSFGNILSEKKADYGADQFLGDSFTYDAYGRFPISQTDAFGHTTFFGGYGLSGNPTSVTDHHGRVTTYDYDTWGNLVRVSHPDSLVEQTAFAWGGTGRYTVSQTTTGCPDRITHYDALGREVRTLVKRFDGQWQRTDKKYDAKGRLSQVSLPYRIEAPSFWSTYTYDLYDRPVRLVEASGKITTWSYDGANTTTVKDGISSNRTVDACGNVVSVTDAGGTITYALRDDGQPSCITAPGNVKTWFLYDRFGRRIMLSDPSAGILTDSHTWNADGSSMTKHSSSNGTVKTYRDPYGRTTLVERANEFDTAYTYDSDGRLSNVVSTNGTGTEYIYDGLDRISSVKETVPDGKWLKKMYDYSTGSVLLSIQYVSQNGLVTTENYSYSNGYNTGICLPDGTVVWNLSAENDLGIPTSITTGSISREYGFSPYGVPTWRKMAGGSLQDFTYTFQVSSGNLLSRSSGANNLRDIFSYDNLNRLTSIGNRQVSYADNGNILSISGVGTLEYGNESHPYQVTSLIPEDGIQISERQRDITYTSFDRPALITEGGRSAVFTYNGDGNRVKMAVSDSTCQTLTRYYIGERYEIDHTPYGTTERLYLGGNAYSAPMVYRRNTGGPWTAYNIGRDYQGSITHIASAVGTPIAEYSYDPWGRLRNPQTMQIFAPEDEPELFLGRGFTGHEHLPWFGLINMNARLYDPLIGRFLSPDPYIQAPNFTQNFNRYSYALNNPLKYTDESGLWFQQIATAIMMGYIGGVMSNAFSTKDNPFSVSNWNWHSINTYTGIFSGVTNGIQLSGYDFIPFPSLDGSIPRGVVYAGTDYLLNGLDNYINHRKFNDNWLEAIIPGFISGSFSGGMLANEHGENIWWGNRIKYNRNKWSIINVDKPDYILSFNLPNDFSNDEQACVPITWAEIESYMGGERSYIDFRRISGYKNAHGTDISPNKYRAMIEELFPQAGIGKRSEFKYLFDPEYIRSAINSHNLFSFLFNKHADNLRALRVFERQPELNTLVFRNSSFNMSKEHIGQFLFFFVF